MTPDNAAAFRPSYRQDRPDPLFTPDMWRMVAVAAALMGGFTAVVSVWHMLGHRHGPGVPVIEAQSGPVRIKPEHPGGMFVAGASDPTSDQTEKLAPPAEQPKIDVLQAQLKAARKKLARQQAELQQAARVGPRIVPVAPVQHAAAMAPLSLMAPPPLPAMPMPSLIQPPHGGQAVQLAAFDTEAAALADWKLLQKKFPASLGPRMPEIVHADFAGHTIWRLRTGGFASVATAATFCARLRDKGTDCKVAAF